jgi:prephenate dehydrogenase
MKNLGKSKILIAGLGQIGGSIGLDLVAKRLAAEVIGYDRDEAVMAEAQRRAVVHRTAISLAEGLHGVDMVVLAVPLRQIIALLPVIAPLVTEHMVIFDVGSTKNEILSTVAQLGIEANYVGGHPLAGNEGCGLEAATTGKFIGKTFVLAPTEVVADSMVSLARELIRGLGATPSVMTAAEHDQLIALTSNLPYVLSLALVGLAGEYGGPSPNIWKLNGGSFKSATRVAASSPELTLDMFMTNGDNISWVVDEVIAQLSAITKLIVNGDEDSLRALITDARNKVCEMRRG